MDEQEVKGMTDEASRLRAGVCVSEQRLDWLHEARRNLKYVIEDLEAAGEDELARKFRKQSIYLKRMAGRLNTGIHSEWARIVSLERQGDTA